MFIRRVALKGERVSLATAIANPEPAKCVAKARTLRILFRFTDLVVLSAREAGKGGRRARPLCIRSV